MASGYVPPQRSEVVVRGDDEKHEEIRRLSSALIEKNPKVYQPLLFSSNSVKEHDIITLRVETVDIFNNCASL